MTPELLQFGITSLIRIGRAGKTALEQAARDEAVLFPRLQEADFVPLLYVNGYFSRGDARQLVADGGPLKHLWDTANNQAKETSVGIETLFLASIELEVKIGNDKADPRSTRTDLAAGNLLIKQWDPSREPVTPWITVMLTAADIALEYLAVNPNVLDADAQSARILGAYAKELSSLLPDDGEFGLADGFAGRLGATFLKAGLSTVAANPDWITPETHLQKLLANTLEPLHAAFPDQSVTEQMVWSNVADAMMGPVAAAAFDTIAEYQVEFLGSDLSVDKALGAVTQAVFLELAKDGLVDQFTEAGLLNIYRAVMGVAVEQPGLFIGGEKPDHEIAREVLSSFAAVLKDADGFDGQLARELTATAISVVGRNAHRFADADHPWHTVAADLVESLTKSISDNIVTSAGNVLSKTQAIELGRIVLTHIGNSPELLADERWEGVVRAMAQAMAADTRLLLSGDDWTTIASVAAAEAAANPERLFKLNGDNVLAGKLISTILTAASQAFAEPEQAKRAVLYGATLKEAVLISIRATSGNSRAVREHMDDIQELVKQLNKFVSDHHEEYGNKEWLRMFRVLLQAVLDGAGAPVIDVDVAEELLTGGGL